MAPALIRARWFDGHSSQARPVLVNLQPGPRGTTLALHPLTPGSEPLQLAHADVNWPETWSATPQAPTLVVDLGAHGSLEIDDASTWQAALDAAGARPRLVERMQTRWTVLLAVLVAAAVGLGAFYRWGTPWAAGQLTAHIPLAWETDMAQQALRQLDGRYLKPSTLTPARQAELRTKFDALARRITAPGLQPYEGYAPPLTLLLRSGMGANAFALPGGTVVMTDGLVEAARKSGLGDDALMGVLAHEIGHVMHRHTTRLLVEQGVLNVGLGLALGDVSTVVSSGAALLTGLAYRRGHETQADCFALALLRDAQLPAAPMASLLLAIDRQEGAASAPADQPGNPSVMLDLLSSHPDSRMRARRLAQGEDQGC